MANGPTRRNIARSRETRGACSEKKGGRSPPTSYRLIVRQRSVNLQFRMTVDRVDSLPWSAWLSWSSLGSVGHRDSYLCDSRSRSIPYIHGVNRDARKKWERRTDGLGKYCGSVN